MRTRKTQKKRREAFLQALGETSNVRLACIIAGVGRSSVYQWRGGDVAFANAWDNALEEATDVLEQEARRRALVGVSEPVYWRGQQVGAIQRYSDNLLMFLLRAHSPKFREHGAIQDRPPKSQGAVIILPAADLGPSAGAGEQSP